MTDAPKKLFSDTTKTAPDEPVDCDLCGVTPIQALAAHQKPALLVGPGWVVCPCFKEGKVAFHVETEVAKREGRQTREDREILECWRDQQNIEHEPGSESKGRTRDKAPAGEVRGEQDWHGFADPDQAETERLEKLDKPLEGRLPKVLKQRLAKEAKTVRSSMNRVFRHLLHRHLLNLEEVHEVEYGAGNVMLKVYVTEDWLTLWKAKKDQLRDHHPKISDADMMASLMLKEWKS